MNIIETKDFARSLQSLPRSTNRLFLVQRSRLKENVRDPRLHLKKLRGLPNVYSFRITRAFRALFYFQNTNTVVLFDIGDRKDIYRNSE